MKAILAFVASIGLSAPVTAQQPQSPPIKMLSLTECALIEKRPAGDYMVNGTITIGNMTITNSKVPPNGISYSGIDPFDVITRSCFTGRPA